MKYVVEHKNNKKETKDKKSTPYIYKRVKDFRL